MSSFGSDAASAKPSRIGSIDALRGLVMLLMLVDHVREFVYLHVQVRDPMDLAVTTPGLAWTRIASHPCAPVFILLAGLSAHLYGQRCGSRAATSAFLLKRGFFLIALEVSVVSFAWTGSLTPPILYLQVIWAIGLCLIALAGLLWLPRSALLLLALAIMLGHNALDCVTLTPDQVGHALWSILHQRDLIPSLWGLARTSYPVLPWIGVVCAGYTLGPLFSQDVPSAFRQRCLLGLGGTCLAAFATLRSGNGYCDPVPWHHGGNIAHTALSFVNLTKYPPSAGFLLLTLGLGLILLALFVAVPPHRLIWLRTFGGAPLFFYLLHLLLLRAFDDGAAAVGLAAPSGRVEANSPAQIWLIAVALTAPLYLACRWMVNLKRKAAWSGLAYL